VTPLAKTDQACEVKISQFLEILVGIDLCNV